jgi:hypothetical protein
MAPVNSNPRSDGVHVAIHLKFKGATRTFHSQSQGSLRELKKQLAAEWPSLPPPSRQKLIGHGQVLQDDEAVAALHGVAQTGEATIMLIQMQAAPGRLERYYFLAGDVWSDAKIMAWSVWRLARSASWQELLAVVGRNVALFFTTLVTPNAPRAARRRQGPADGAAPPQ